MRRASRHAGRARWAHERPVRGPYYIASYTPRQQLILRRNPNYHGDRPHHLAQMVVAIGIDTPRALKDIEAGRADYALDGVRLAAGSSLQARYGPGSKAAKAGRQQYFVSPANGTRYLHMNMSRPLFAQHRLRRAVNYAIDRAAVVAQGQRFPESNPFSTGSATDAYLPASIVGATDSHAVPLSGPDLRRAEQIAGPVHATAIMYTPNIAPWQQEAEIVRRDLEPLGIDVEVKQFPFDEFYTRISRRGEPFDLAVSGWSFSSTDPAEVFSLFDGNTIRRIDNADLSYFHNSAFDRQLAAAAKLSGVARYRAYGRLELELERNFVPAAPLANNGVVTSSRPASDARSINPSSAWTSRRCACAADKTLLLPMSIGLAPLCLPQSSKRPQTDGDVISAARKAVTASHRPDACAHGGRPGSAAARHVWF